MKRAILFCVALPLVLTACEFSLAGDVTPPPDAVISSEITPMPVEPPVYAPDLAAGAQIYADRCAPCHGAGGLGDGEQAGQLPIYPAAIGESNLARESSPEDWFRIISQGRLQRYMPPFAAALTEQQRWDVLAYVYGFGWDQETLNRGAEIYTSHQDAVDELLNGGTLILVNVGKLAPLGLGEADAQDLTAYLQATGIGIGLPTTEVEQPAPTSGGIEAVALGNLGGHVIYGGRNQFPGGLEAHLYGFDHTNQVVSETTQVANDGSFSFADVPMAAGRIFFAQVDYKGLSFFSEFLAVEEPAQPFVLDVPIYDTTSDTSQLAVEKIQLVFVFPQAGTLRIVETVTISNLGDLAVTPDENSKPVLHFSLPTPASNLAFEEGQLGDRYLPDETGFGDTRAVLPGMGSYDLLFAYDLPYDTAISYPIQIDMPTKVVAAFLPEGQIKMESDEFKLQGSQEINGTNYSVYAAQEGYSAGDQISLAIRGRNPSGTRGLNLDDSLVIGLAGLTAAVGFAWLWLRRLPETSANSILEQIALLDENYSRGKVVKSIYIRQRNELKSRLRRVVSKKGRQ